MSRSDDPSPSSVRETVQNPWVQVSPMPPVSSDEDEDTDEEVQRRCSRLTCLYYPHLACSRALRWIRRHPRLVISFASLIWLAYVIFVVIHNFAVKNRPFDMCNGGGLIVCISSAVVTYIVFRKMADIYTNHNIGCPQECCVGPWHWCHGMWGRRYVRVVVFTLIFIAIVLLTHRGQYVSYHQGISVIGYLTIILVAYLFSVNPEQINWKLVVQNLSLQFVTVYSMIVWDFGRLLLQCSAEKFSVFFEFSAEAAHVAFSTELPQMMAIELLCSLTITGCYMHILYYTGVLQGFLHKLGFVLENITGATAIESICTALCALCGGIETSVMLEPYIVLLTMSELHLFVASGFATMTGVMLTSYMSQGINQVNLMTTNFATCNGLIAVSKIIHPETHISVTTYQNLKFSDRDEHNVIDAAVRGATAVLKVLAYVIAGLIAMISLVNMGNAFVAWLLGNIGLYGMDALTIVAFLFRPLVFLLGVPWEFVNEVADLFTIKTVKNEYFAYMAFLELQKTRHFPHREEALTTAMLYGFSNIAHIGVTTAFLTALAPERRRDISCIVPKAMITGMLVNLLTASVIGILVSEITIGEIPQNTTDSVRNMTNATAESFSAKLNAFQIPNLLGF